jgi:hypothetical protein
MLLSWSCAYFFPGFGLYVATALIYRNEWSVDYTVRPRIYTAATIRDAHAIKVAVLVVALGAFVFCDFQFCSLVASQSTGTFKQMQMTTLPSINSH